MMHASAATRQAPPRSNARPAPAWPLLLLVSFALSATVPAARAGVLFDFEGPFLVDPGRTIKDHSMVFDGQQWHCFYIRGVQGGTNTASETQFGHATTFDLRNWMVRDPALSVDVGAWDGRNVWAPQVLPDPDGIGWNMFYTGVESNLLQRMGRADSPNLYDWVKAGENPLLSPDPTVYLWSASLPVPELSAFRDPYVFEYQGQYHVLHTALVPDANVAAGRRGVIHHSVSNDLVNWTPLAPLAVNNSPVGVWREIESVQLIQRGGRWHLFFTFFGIVGVQYVSNASFDTGWDLASAVTIDQGIAAEVTPIDGTNYLFTRHAVDQHFIYHPDSNQLFYTLRADTLRFTPSGHPTIVRNAVFDRDWPVRDGIAFVYGPTFGDNQVERGEFPANVAGHGFLSSREFWPGPLSGFGGPGGTLGSTATGSIRSRWFTVEPNDVEYTFRMAGPADPDCRFELVERVEVLPDSFEVFVRRSVTTPGTNTLLPMRWDVQDLRGSTVAFRAIDQSEISFLSIDDIRAVRDPVVTTAPTAPRDRGRLRAPAPNPFNPRTVLGFDLAATGHVGIEIFDMRGRRVRTMDLGSLPGGPHEVVWDGRSDGGGETASGVYLVRLVVAGESVDARKVSLAR